MVGNGPQTKRIDVIERIHGVELVDPYRWLEDNDSQEVQEWLKLQNAYTRSILDKIPLRKGIKSRLSQLIKTGTVGVPVPRGNRYFFQERKGNEDLGVLYVQDGLRGSPRVLIDPNTLSEDKTTVLQGWSPSRDGKLLTYNLSEAANDQGALYVLDIDTGKNLPDTIPAEFYPSFASSPVWALDDSGFWYTRRLIDVPKGEEKFHGKIYFHRIGTDFRDDPIVFGDGVDKVDIPWTELSEDGRYLLVTVYMNSTGVRKMELYLQDLENAEQGFVPIVKGPDALFGGYIHRDTIYILTNHNAPLWRVMAVNIKNINGGIDNWKTIIPESEYKIEDIFAIRDKLFVERLENVHSALKMYNLDGTSESEIKLPTLGSLMGLGREKEGNEFFFGFTSFSTPYTIYQFDLVKNEYAVFKKIDIGLDVKNFTVKQVWYSSKDGTKIPMFLVHKKGLKRNGNNPVMLYGYGGFDVSVIPQFDKTIIPFLENGGVYAVANIRGGGEFGEEWHKAGMLDRRQNVFDDFIAAAEWLIKNRYTNSNRLAIFGWSNGGLLVGATEVQRPDLFKTVVVGAPVLDMLRYHLFFGGRLWIPDYGNPEEPKMFHYLLGYSPYHNVKDGEKYPATLIVTADSDDRVHPAHAYKMAARLQAANTSSNPILLRVEVKAGHGGAAPMYKLVEQYADIWAFVFKQLGIKKQSL